MHTEITPLVFGLTTAAIVFNIFMIFPVLQKIYNILFFNEPAYGNSAEKWGFRVQGAAAYAACYFLTFLPIAGYAGLATSVVCIILLRVLLIKQIPFKKG